MYIHTHQSTLFYFLRTKQLKDLHLCIFAKICIYMQYLYVYMGQIIQKWTK